MSFLFFVRLKRLAHRSHRSVNTDLCTFFLQDVSAIHRTLYIQDSGPMTGSQVSVILHNAIKHFIHENVTHPIRMYKNIYRSGEAGKNHVTAGRESYFPFS